jgi:hypothetical protein
LRGVSAEGAAKGAVVLAAPVGIVVGMRTRRHDPFSFSFCPPPPCVHYYLSRQQFILAQQSFFEAEEEGIVLEICRADVTTLWHHHGEVVGCNGIRSRIYPTDHAYPDAYPTDSSIVQLHSSRRQ